MATSTDINALENTIQAIIAQAAGLSGTLVIWEHQNNPQPAKPYLSLFSEDLPRVGTAEETVRDNPDSTLGDGEEILLKSRGDAEVEVRVHAFSLAAVSSSGVPSARAMLLGMRQALEAESMTAIIEAANLALVSVGAVMNLPRVVETQFQGRATLTLKFRYADEFEEATTFIETTNTLVGTYS